MRKVFLTSLFLACSIAIPSLAKTYLVSVGIADYPGARADLKVSANDAKTIAGIYSATKNTSVVILTNSTATMSSVVNTMRATFANSKPDDTVVLYFSGHGSPGSFVCYDGYLKYQSVFKILKECSAKNKIVIADACYSGKMRTGKKKSNAYNPNNIVLFLSSRTNEVSKETPFSNSLFTLFLERGLRGGADYNHDKTITAHEIYEFVHDGVLNSFDGKQHPVMWGKFDPNTPFIKW